MISRILLLMLCLSASAQVLAQTNMGRVKVDSGGQPFEVKSSAGWNDMSTTSESIFNGESYEVRISYNAGIRANFYHIELFGPHRKRISLWAEKSLVSHAGHEFSVSGARMVPPQSFDLKAVASVEKGAISTRREEESCPRLPEPINTLWGERYYCDGVKVGQHDRCESGSRIVEKHVLPVSRTVNIEFKSAGKTVKLASTQAAKSEEVRAADYGQCLKVSPTTNSPASANLTPEDVQQIQ